MTFRYVVPRGTLAEVEEWCEANGMRPLRLHRGPDGLIRGTCCAIDEVQHSAIPTAPPDLDT